MRIHNALIAGIASLALVACEQSPTNPVSDQAALDSIDPVVATFDASQGLPGGPFGAPNGAPFLGAMPFAGAPASAADGRGPGAAFPDSIRLTDGQKAQITALVSAFMAANAADLATMKAAHVAAREAIHAGKSHDEVKAILDGAKAAADRVHANAEALHAAIAAVLTPAQRAWLDAHKPDRPPRTP